MNTKKLRIPLDIFMTILSVVLMGGTILFSDERIHQICGITLFLLWAVHFVLNHRWFSSIFNEKYHPYRIMQLVVNIGVLISALFLMISGLLLLWFIPADWVGRGLGFARITHLLASHWYYVFMAFHLGLHAALIASKMKIHGTIPRVICMLVSLYGVYAFIIRRILKYLFGVQKFFFFDFERGYVLFALDYISILVLFGTMAHYLAKLITRKPK